jgi:hypothetical protein
VIKASLQAAAKALRRNMPFLMMPGALQETQQLSEGHNTLPVTNCHKIDRQITILAVPAKYPANFQNSHPSTQEGCFAYSFSS